MRRSGESLHLRVDRGLSVRLALAAPLTQGTAQRLLARLNIYLKNGPVIERLAEVDTVVLDKPAPYHGGCARGEIPGGGPDRSRRTDPGGGAVGRLRFTR